MSAFTYRHLDALSVAISGLSAVDAPASKPLRELLAMLQRLNECSKCGLMFDGFELTCQHCQVDQRAYEQREANGGHL